MLGKGAVEKGAMPYTAAMCIQEGRLIIFFQSSIGQSSGFSATISPQIFVCGPISDADINANRG